MRPALTTARARQFLTLLLGVSLGLAIFVSPIELHNNPESIFFATKTSATVEHSSHNQHQHHEKAKAIQCLRCVLYGFQAPETIAPFIAVLVVLGFIKVAKPIAPDSFITLSKTARAPPTAFL